MKFQMYSRFLQYLRVKGISQRSLSESSHVSASTVSRFCAGQPIGSDKLFSLLQVCDDLSLEWLFFGIGEMFRGKDSGSVNIGQFAGSDMSSDHSVRVINSRGARVVTPKNRDCDLLELLQEKDAVISDRDQTISRLHEVIVSLMAGKS